LKSILSNRNFVKVAVEVEHDRKSGKEFLRAREVTYSEGGIPGRIVRSQEPNLAQTISGEKNFELWLDLLHIA